MDRMPHIWCPSCGIGIAVTSFAAALAKAQVDLNKVSIVSGIGCTGRVAGYVKLDSFHTTHGRPIAFGTGIQVANPDIKVVVFSGDGDLIAIGGKNNYFYFWISNPNPSSKGNGTAMGCMEGIKFYIARNPSSTANT